jgi:hypothetical protein
VIPELLGLAAMAGALGSDRQETTWLWLVGPADATPARLLVLPISRRFLVSSLQRFDGLRRAQQQIPELARTTLTAQPPEVDNLVGLSFLPIPGRSIPAEQMREALALYNKQRTAVREKKGGDMQRLSRRAQARIAIGALKPIQQKANASFQYSRHFEEEGQLMIRFGIPDHGVFQVPVLIFESTIRDLLDMMDASVLGNAP